MGTNLNTVLDEYPALKTVHLIYGEPRWLRLGWRGLLLLSGCGLAYFTTSAATMPIVATLLLWIVSGLAIVVAVRSSSASIHFASDAQGVYFPSWQKLRITGPAMSQKWLFVPWSNISSLGVQLSLDECGNTKCVTIGLRASEEEQRVFFKGMAKLDFDEASPIGDSGSILVGFPSAFRSPYKAVTILRDLQRQQTANMGNPEDVTLLVEH